MALEGGQLLLENSYISPTYRIKHPNRPKFSFLPFVDKKMAEEVCDTGKKNSPKTKDLGTVKQGGRSKTAITPQILFRNSNAADSEERSTYSEPTSTKRRSKKGNKTLVLTPQGKQVLSSDARLHLEKLKQRTKASGEKQVSNEVNEVNEVNIEVDEELRRLDEERRVLAEKIRQKREILRLQKELTEVSEGYTSSGYQTKDYESSWRTSMGSGYTRTEGSSGSYSSRRRKRKSKDDESSEEEEDVFRKEKPKSVNLTEDDVVMFKDFIRTHSEGTEVPSENPLSKEVERAKINRNLKVPSIDQFDGSTDPSDFIHLFDGRMTFYGHSEMAKCQFFSTCLKGTSLLWFNNLPPRSIDSWTDLKRKFKTRFSGNKKGGKITASLMTIRQKSSESLREYLTRFRKEMAEIPNLIEELAINYLAAGVDKSRHSLLLEEFFEKSPRTLQAAMEIFEHRLTLQEAVGSIQSSRSPKIRTDRLPDRSSRWEYRRTNNRNDKPEKQPEQLTSPAGEKERYSRTSDRSNASRMSPPKQRPWAPRPREDRDFTKLNTDKATILAVLKTDPSYRPPRPMNPNRPPSDRYCEYHEDTGHTTERCYQLKNLIEDKVQKGQLNHFIQSNSAPQLEDRDRVIDVISGGYAAGGASNNAKKSYAREIFQVDFKRPRRNPSPVISFSDDDFKEGLLEGHQDALVISAKIGNNTVKKILVDNGSSVDILYHNAYSRMDLGDRKMKDAKDVPLYGFTGNEVKVIGVIDLPVLFGSPPCQSWQMVKFHVINAISSYNAILGRTTITALKAITSITHLKMKFPTEFGIGEVCGDQQTARQCYIGCAIPKKKLQDETSVNQIVEVDPREIIEVPKPSAYEPLEPIEEIVLDVNLPERVIKIG